MLDDYPFIRELRSPIDSNQLRPLDPKCRVVQFSEPLTDSEFVRVAEFMKSYPDVSFRIYGHYSGADDLSFLKHFPFLNNFQSDVYEIRSWSGLEHLPDSLKYLGLGVTKKKFSLSILDRFAYLEDLFLDGHAKDIEVLTKLLKLKYLTLKSITLADLTILAPLHNLRSFGLKLGGTADLAGLESVQSLRYLELWMIRGLTDISVVGELLDLRYLFLQNLKHIRAIPSLGRLTKLSRVYMEALDNLVDLSPIADAPNLEDLILGNMRHLKIENLTPLKGHPKLKTAGVGLCSMRRNREATDFLGIPWPTVSNPPNTYYVELDD